MNIGHHTWHNNQRGCQIFSRHSSSAPYNPSCLNIKGNSHLKSLVRPPRIPSQLATTRRRSNQSMAIEAWFMDESGEDQRFPHKKNPPEYVSVEQLADIGVLYWHLNPEDYENDEELKKIRESRGYSYMDLLDLCPEKIENYQQKLKNFYTEHIHADEEIRYCLEGSGYFDVRDKDDRWIRIWIKAGDLIVLPAGIYHRFTLDTTNYVKLMRLFVGEPVWTAYNRPQEEHPARKEYMMKRFSERMGALPLKAH